MDTETVVAGGTTAPYQPGWLCPVCDVAPIDAGHVGTCSIGCAREAHGGGCNERSPDGTYGCTRPKGHPGSHVAGAVDCIVAVWPQAARGFAPVPRRLVPVRLRAMAAEIDDQLNTARHYGATDSRFDAISAALCDLATQIDPAPHSAEYVGEVRHASRAPGCSCGWTTKGWRADGSLCCGRCGK